MSDPMSDPIQNENRQQPESGGTKKEKRKRRPWLRVLDVLIVVIALTGLYLIISPMITHWQQDRLTRRLEQAYQQGDGQIEIDPDAWPVEGEELEYARLESLPPPTVTETVTEPSEPEETTTETESEITPEPTTDRQPPADTVTIEAIGRIEIEKINLSMPVASRSTAQDLRVAIGHYSPSAGFGQPGLTVLLGHRMYTYGRHFNRLDEVRVDDTVVLSDRQNRYVYVVEQVRIVEPAEMLDQLTRLGGDQPRLMLVTCDPVRIASHRMLVYAYLDRVEPLP